MRNQFVICDISSLNTAILIMRIAAQIYPNNKVANDTVPVQFKVLPGVRAKLKTVPDWQERLRQFVVSVASRREEMN